MSLIDGIREKIAAGEFEYSRHALDQSLLRDIHPSEFREAIASGVVIEDYPDDKYGPSCLVLGLTAAGLPLHVQCSYPMRPLVRVVTMYEPDPLLWVDFRTRRR